MPKHVVLATTLADLANAEQENSVQSSSLTCPIRQHSGWLSPRRPSEQMPEQRPQLSCQQPKSHVETPTTKRTEARAVP